jgi:hypothetical protein
MDGKWISYLRVSTDRQGKSGLGIEAQRNSVAEYLNGGNWKMVSWGGPQLFRIECRHRIGKRGPSAVTSSVKLPEVALRALQTPIGPARRSPVCTRKVWVGEALSCAA